MSQPASNPGAPGACRGVTRWRASRRWGTGIGLLGLAAVALFWFWRSASPPADFPDPRLTFKTDYLNVRPGVAYVGDARCADCHREHVESFRQHPMGKSAGLVKDFFHVEDYAAPTPTFGGWTYAVRRDGDRVIHQEQKLNAAGKPVLEREQEVHIAIGSGAHARTYLINRDDYLFESPITWFSTQGRWDLSPGYKTSNMHFDRPVLKECLFCHVNQVEPIPGPHNQYDKLRIEPIGCERCHGPGALHVAREEQGLPAEYSIVNPGKLPLALRDAVCEQCHLLGENKVSRPGRSLLEYRPGLPLHEFTSVFVFRPGFASDFQVVGQAVQMRWSRCYEQSGGKLGCISCHDPHRAPPPAEQAAFYRARCLSCHAEPGKQCSAPVARRREKSPEDSCIVCHMPRSADTNITHVSITDHRILRDPERPPEPPPLPAGTSPIMHFHEHWLNRQEQDERVRDRVMAQFDFAMKSRAPESCAAQTVAVLERQVQRWPRDLAALNSLGFAQWAERAPEQALRAFESILVVSPRNEVALFQAAGLALELDQAEQGEAYLKRTIEVNPSRPQYHLALARWYVHKERWPEAIASGERVLQLDAAQAEAHRLLIRAQLGRGDRDRALAHWEAYAALEPADLAEVRDWLRPEPR